VAKPVYVVVVVKPNENGSPFVVGPFSDHAAAGAAADAHLEIATSGVRAYVRSLYEPSVLLLRHSRKRSGDTRKTRRSR
jgi:hypothetical protein